jgi:hypothetical protein
MALDTPVKISAQYLDGLGTRAATQYYGLADSTQTLAAIVTEADNMLGELAGLSTAQLKLRNLAIDISDLSAAVPDANSRVEQCGIFNFANSSDSRRWGAVVPAFNEARMTNGKINLSDAGVISWLNEMLNTGGVLQFTNLSEQQLSALRDAFIAFRKHRRSLARTSFER